MDDEKLKELFGKYGKISNYGETVQLRWFLCGVWSVNQLLCCRTGTQHPGHDWWKWQIQGIWLCQFREARRCTKGGDKFWSYWEYLLYFHKMFGEEETLPRNNFCSIMNDLFCSRLWTTWMVKKWMADKCTLAVLRRKGSVRTSSNANLNRWNKIVWPDTRWVCPFWFVTFLHQEDSLWIGSCGQLCPWNNIVGDCLYWNSMSGCCVS